jgi:hypothetical protein
MGLARISSRKGRAVAVAVAASGAVAIAVGGSSTANAQAANGHWYSVAGSTSAGIGARSTVYISGNSYAYDAPTGGFIEQTLWQGSGGGNWTEVGWTQGWQGSRGVYWYWADQRPGGGYNEHLIGGAGPLYSYHDLDITRSATITSQWVVSIDGSGYGLSTGNGSAADTAESGLESTSNLSNMDVTSASNLQWKNASGTWNSGWGNNTAVFPPATGSWKTVGTFWADAM